MCIYLYCFLLLSVKILLRNNEKKTHWIWNGSLWKEMKEGEEKKKAKETKMKLVGCESFTMNSDGYCWIFLST